MNGWMGKILFYSLLSYLLTDKTSSLRHFFSQLYFSEQPLLWATSALSCLPAGSFVASATHVFSSRNCYNAFSSFQLQSRIAQEQHYRQELPLARLAVTMRLTTFSCNSACQERRGITHMLCCAQPCQCVFSQPVANLHGRSVATNRPTFAQRQQCRLRTSDHFSFRVFSAIFASSCHSLVHILPTSSSKSAPNASVSQHFEIHI